jgi:hypothetical protein
MFPPTCDECDGDFPVVGGGVTGLRRLGSDCPGVRLASTEALTGADLSSDTFDAAFFEAASSARILSALLGGLSSRLSYVIFRRFAAGSSKDLDETKPLSCGVSFDSARGLSVSRGLNSCEKMQFVKVHCGAYGQGIPVNKFVVVKTILE